MIARARLFALIAGLALVTLPQVAPAQDEPIETFTTVGLGQPIAPLYTRARGMSANGVALHGGNLTAVNPASLARATSLGVWASGMFENASVSGEGVSGDLNQTIFPIGRVVISSTRKWTLAVSFQSFLDQNGGIQFIDTLNLSTGDVEFQETRFSDGGISRFNFEGATWVGNKLTLGAALQFYRGETRVAVERAFEEDAGFIPYRSVGAIDYSGFGFSLGAEFQPVPEVILGGTVAWANKLDARNDSSDVKGTFDLPLQTAVGGSVQLSPRLIAVIGFGWANWSVLDDDISGGAVDTYNVGGGIEFTLSADPGLFVRAGARWDRLPFKVGGAAASERVLSLGTGLRVTGGRARIDASLEFGSRGDEEKNGIKSSFTRFAVGVAVFSN